jgi:hypothetical protein
MVNHPLVVGQRIEAQQPQCPCKGASYKLITGKILKVIINSSGTWYYIDQGMTIKADKVTKVFG